MCFDVRDLTSFFENVSQFITNWMGEGDVRYDSLAKET